MRQFQWIERNLERIEDRALSAEEVEAAFDRVYRLEERPDGSYEMLAETPTGRPIRVVWSFASDDERKPQTSLANWARR
jgi:hypothetical protein